VLDQVELPQARRYVVDFMSSKQFDIDCLQFSQILFAPIFIGAFFSSLLILEGHSSKVIPKLKQVREKQFFHVLRDLKTVGCRECLGLCGLFFAVFYSLSACSGLVECRGSKLEDMDSFPVSQFSSCTTAITGHS
jgi:hypothetical protein